MTIWRWLTTVLVLMQWPVRLQGHLATGAGLASTLALLLGLGCASLVPRAPASPTLTDGRNQAGLFGVGGLRKGPTLGPAGDGSVKVAGEDWVASPGFEALYARQIFAPTEKTPMEVTLDLPVTVLPRVRQPSGAEIFDPTTGRSIGPAPDYAAMLFTPRVSLRYRTEWPVQIVVTMGGGIALFSETRNGQPYKEIGYPLQFLVGLSTRFRPHWAVRGQFGPSAHGVAVERGLYVVNAGIVYVF